MYIDEKDLFACFFDVVAGAVDDYEQFSDEYFRVYVDGARRLTNHIKLQSELWNEKLYYGDGKVMEIAGPIQNEGVTG